MTSTSLNQANPNPLDYLVEMFEGPMLVYEIREENFELLTENTRAKESDFRELLAKNFPLHNKTTLQEAIKEVYATGERFTYTVELYSGEEEISFVCCGSHVFVAEKERTMGPSVESYEEFDYIEYLSGVLHDISNISAKMQGYIDVFLQDEDETLYDKLSSQIKSLEFIIQNTKDFFAEVTRDFYEQTPLLDILSASAEMIVPGGVEVALPDKLPVVRCNSGAVRRLFNNIFENAIFHGNPNQIEVRSLMKSSGLFLYITNDGKPIDPALGERIFQAGFSTRPDSDGLGLAIVQKIAHSHGWELRLHSSSPPTFRLFIPRSLLPENQWI